MMELKSDWIKKTQLLGKILEKCSKPPSRLMDVKMVNGNWVMVNGRIYQYIYIYDIRYIS
jgi:hypothetical protein